MVAPAAVGAGMPGDVHRTVAMCLGLREGSVRTGPQGLRSGTDTQGSRVMIAAGHRWGRGSLAEAAKLWHNSRPPMLTRASSVTRWRLSGKSRFNDSFAALDGQNLRRALEFVLWRAPTLLVVAHP